MTRRSSTAFGSGDVSRPRRASATAESALFWGYHTPAPIEVIQDCACGGAITAFLDDYASIVGAIRCHQELTIHRLWRSQAGIA